MKTVEEMAKEILHFHGCVDGSCPHELRVECLKALIMAGHASRDAEVAKLVKELETAVKYYDDSLPCGKECHGRRTR